MKSTTPETKPSALIQRRKVIFGGSHSLKLFPLYALLGWGLPVAGSFAQAPGIIPDSRGPVTNAGMNVVVEADGVEAPGYVFHDPGAKPTAWTAKWINLPGSQHAKNGIESQANLFRKEVIFDQAPSSVKAWMTVENYRTVNYRLYINGKMAARGPADYGQDITGKETGRLFYDCLDLTPLFHAGKNVVAVEVFAGTGLLFEAAVQTPGGNSVITSDASWRSAPCNYLQNTELHPEDKMGGGKCLTYDGNEEPVGWELPGFDDSSWTAAQIAAAPGEQFTANELPPLMEIHYPMQKIVNPTGALEIPNPPFQGERGIKITGNASFSVQFDRIMAAHWGIKVKGGGGARIYLDANQTSDAASGAKRWVLSLRDGLQFFESPNYYGVGTIRVTVCNVTSPVEIMDVSLNYRSQPVIYQGSFSCNDGQLNEIWKDCRWVTQINLQTQHLDSSIHQEPISDYGDYLIEDLASYNAFAPKFWLARQDFRKWAWIMKNSSYQTFHTSYALLWLRDLLSYYDYTGDKSLLVELAPYVNGLLDQFSTYVGDNGLISNAPNYMFMDWATIGGFGTHHPPAVIGQGYMTAFYYQALADGLRVAQVTGDQDRIARYTLARQQIKTAYNRELWNADKGLYRDGKPFVTKIAPSLYLPADTNIETFSAHNNVLAVLYDLAPPDRQQAIMDKVLAMTPWNVGDYYMHFVFCAIAHAGLFDKYGTAWLRKLEPIPETHTFNSDDLCHGWVATPLYQMSTQILGITPRTPGFDQIAIYPKLCDLTFARGVVPTPHGNVAMSWERKPGQLDMKVTVPTGTQADFGLPVGAAKTPSVTVDGKPLWNEGNTGGTISGVTDVQLQASTLDMKLAPGTYDFAVSGL
jgi:alpha-L-rhamnosidase